MLSKTGYQPNCHIMFIASGWFSAKFCLVDKFAKQYFLLNRKLKCPEAWISAKICINTKYHFVDP